MNLGASQDPSDWICLGTRLVVLTHPTPTSTAPGKTFDDGDNDNDGNDRDRTGEKKYTTTKLPSEGLLVVYQNRPHLPPKNSRTTAIIIDSERRSSSSQSSTTTTTTTIPILLRIEVGTNSHVYRSPTPIDWSRDRSGKKGQDDSQTSSSLSDLLLQDGREHADTTVRFLHSPARGSGGIGSREGGLDLIIQQRLPSGLQKYLLQKPLTLVLPTPSSRPSSSSSSCLLEFSHSLGQAVNQSLKDIQQRDRELEEKQHILNQWKGTAQRLSIQVWQKEKDQLIKNFVSLWNQKQQKEKEQYRQLYEELEHTKQELEVERKKKKSTIDRKPVGRSRSTKLGQVKEEEEDDEEAEREVGDDAENEEMMVNGAEDDLEGGHEPIPLHEVAALAAGRRLVPSNTSTILTANDTISATSLLKQQQAYEQRKKAAKEKKSKAKAAKKVAGMDLSDSDTDDGRGASNGKAVQRTRVTVNERATTTAKVIQQMEQSDSDTDDGRGGKSQVVARQRRTNEKFNVTEGTAKVASMKQSDSETDDGGGGGNSAAITARQQRTNERVTVDESETSKKDGGKFQIARRRVRSLSLSSDESETDASIDENSPNSRKRARLSNENARNITETMATTATTATTRPATVRGGGSRAMASWDSTAATTAARNSEPPMTAKQDDTKVDEDEEYRAQIRARISRIKYDLSSSDEE